MATVLDELITRVGWDVDHKGLRKLDRQIGRLKTGLNNFSRKAIAIGGGITAAAVATVASFATQEAKLAEVSSKTGVSVDELKRTTRLRRARFPMKLESQ